MEKLQRMGKRIIAVIGSMLFLALTFYSWRYTLQSSVPLETLSDSADSPLGKLLLLLLAVEIVFRLGSWRQYLTAGRTHVIAVCAAVVTVLIGLKFVFATHGVVISDSLHLYMAAQEICTGEADFVICDDYFYCYPNQLGLAGMYAVLLRLTGIFHADMFRVIHALCAGLTVYMGFRIVRELSDDRRAEVLYLCGIVSYIPLYLYVLFIYGETIGVCAAFCTVWLFIRANRCKTEWVWVYWVSMGIAMAVTYMARQGLIVVGIAMLIVQLLRFLRSRKLVPLLGMAGVLVVALGMQSLVMWLSQQRLGTDFGRGIPSVSWIAMGMQENTYYDFPQGSYNGYIVDVYRETDYDAEAAAQKAKAYIAERFEEWSRDPADLVQFYKRKILGQWNEPTYSGFIMTRLMEEPKPWVEDLYFGDAQVKWCVWLNAFQGVIYLLILGRFLWLLSGRAEPEQYLLGLILIGGFCFSVLWEAKSRYIYPYSVLAIPCAAMSLTYYYDMAPRWLKRAWVKIKNRFRKEERENV